LQQRDDFIQPGLFIHGFPLCSPHYIALLWAGSQEPSRQESGD